MKTRRFPAAVKKAIPEIAQVIDQVARSLRDGGRLIYVGAGSSGRIAALDSVRVPAHLLHGSGTGAVHHGRRTQGAGLGRRGQRRLRRAGPAGHCPPPPHAQGRCGWRLRFGPHSLRGGRRGLCARPRSAHCRRHLQPRHSAGRGRRYRHRRRRRPRGHLRLHAHEGRHRPEDDSEHDHHRRHDPAGLCVREPDGQRAHAELEAGRARHPHPHVRLQDRPRRPRCRPSRAPAAASLWPW